MEHTFRSLLLVFLHLSYAAVVIPAPYGKYGVDITEIVLTDITRLDPFAPYAVNRSVIVSAFQPVALRSECDWRDVPYMPEQAAALMDKNTGFPILEGTFESFRMQVCSPKRQRAYAKHHSWSKTEIPLVLMSPGNSASRLEYSVVAQAVASQGYTVVTIDHPYDAKFVVFPDGEVVNAVINEPDARIPKQLKVLELLVDTRVSDARFVHDELEKPAIVHHLFSNLSPYCAPNTNHVAMIGHSLGGVTAMLASSNDNRVIGTLNMDGGLDGVRSFHQDGTDVPVLLFESDSNSLPNTQQPDWPKIWPQLRDWKPWLRLDRSEHGTFTDFPYLVHLSGIEPVPPEMATAIGRISGDRLMEIISACVDAFLDFVLRAKHRKLLEGPTEAFSEVEYLRS
ncbi:hypothetical protein LTR49_021833 [Elasticomyces elasticus]|nr:hypothetical protein LTR49_021833 [Elasticomyces elasticus]